MKTKIYLLTLIILSVFIFAAIRCQSKSKISEQTIKSTSSKATVYDNLYPEVDEIQNVKLRTEIKEYKGDALYDFLNGGAELYIAYDIVAATSAEYTVGENSIIEVSVYDMGTSANAFGMYSTGRYANAEYVSIGNEAIKTLSTLDFWKGKYYCKLVSFDETPESQKAMVELGIILANNIKDVGNSPKLLKLLPEASKIPKSEKYFRKQLALNNIHYVDNENVLQLSEQTEGVVAQYQFGQTKVDGFIIKYPTEQAADAAYTSYLMYLSQKGKVEKGENNKATITLQNGKFTFVALRENYLIGVWSAQDAKNDYELIEKTLALIASK